MLRYDRSRFLAFGVLPAVNVVALLLYGLAVSTTAAAGSEKNLPALIVIAGICLLSAMMAAIKRGRDVGWPALLTVLAFWVTLGMGPIFLLLIGYLAFARTRDSAAKFGAPAGPATAGTWVLALPNLLWPWIVLVVLVSLS